MKLQQIFEAEADSYGLVITRDKANNKFEDIDLYDMKANDIIGNKTGHAKNLFDGLVKVVREKNGWARLEPFLKSHSKSSKALGGEYGDAENFHITLYGPFTDQTLGNLIDQFEEEH